MTGQIPLSLSPVVGEVAGRPGWLDVAMIRHRATERAVLVSPDGNTRRAVWLPLSQVEVTCREIDELQMAGGVPVVQPGHGAFPEILECTGGGITFEPNRSDLLADELAALYCQPERMEQLRKQGAYGVRKHYSVSRMADRAVELYGQIIASAGQAAVS